MLRAATRAGRVLRSSVKSQKRLANTLGCFEGIGDMKHDIFKFNLGAFDCTIFREDVLTFDMRQWFIGVSFEEKKKLLSSWADQIIEKDGEATFSLPVTFMLVRTPTNNILIDGGSAEHTALFGEASILKDSGRAKKMLESEIKPEEIDHIFLTHAHVDHVGLLRDGDEPYFPNAKVVLGQTELENTKLDREQVQTGYCQLDPTLPGSPLEREEILTLCVDPQQHSLDVIKDENFITFKDKQEIVPGVSCTEIGGHTIGCGLIEIKSGQETLLASGDQFYHPISLSHPELGIFVHAHPWQVIANIKQIREHLVNQKGTLVYSCHFPHPAPSVLTNENGHFKTTSIVDL